VLVSIVLTATVSIPAVCFAVSPAPLRVFLNSCIFSAPFPAKEPSPGLLSSGP
jgi:hypothetical protein